MNDFIELKIWGRLFNIEIVYDCYPGEEILANQRTALENFLSKPYLIDDALPNLIQYCLTENKEDIIENKIDNIFKYVIPKSIYISRTNNSEHKIGLMCNYKFNLEHGIVIIFVNDCLDMIGIQDHIL